MGVKSLSDAFAFVVKEFLELVEQRKAWLAHQLKDCIARMFRGHLQAPAHMVVDEFAGIFFVVANQFLVIGFLQQHVVTHAASNEQVLHLRVVAHFAVKFQKLVMVRVHVVADFRREATGACALLTTARVAATHVVHVGTRAAQIGDGAGKAVHFRNQIHFAQNAFATTARNELALVCVDGAKTATAKTAAVRVDAKLNHVERRHVAALSVTRVRFAGVVVFKAFVELAVFQRRVRGINHHGLFCDILQNTALEPLVAFDVYPAAVLDLIALVGEAFLVTIQAQVFPLLGRRNLSLGRKVSGLRNRMQAGEGYALLQESHDFFQRFFAHAVHEYVGLRIEKNAGLKFVAPVVVMRHAAQA